MAGRPLGTLAFFLGPAGSGKSTLAREWCLTRTRAVQIELDKVRGCIVSGFADPQSISAESNAQYAVSAKACCEMARAFLEAGFDVSIDDVGGSRALEKFWAPHLEGLDWRTVVIRPDLDTALRRNANRQKYVNPEIIRRQHAEAAEWPAELVVDTTGLEIEESLARAIKALESQGSAD